MSFLVEGPEHFYFYRILTLGRELLFQFYKMGTTSQDVAKRGCPNPRLWGSFLFLIGTLALRFLPLPRRKFGSVLLKMHSNAFCSFHECCRTVQPMLKDQLNYKSWELQFLAVAHREHYFSLCFPCAKVCHNSCCFLHLLNQGAKKLV